MMTDDRQPRQVAEDHWLVRATTIRLLWIGSTLALAALVLLDLVIAKHPHFSIEGTFGFGAWFGFATCVAMVLIAKGIGLVLKRPDTYYED